MCPYELKNGVNFAQFCFGESGLLPVFEEFSGLVRTNFPIFGQKSGLLPVFENQKWAEKFGCIF